MKLYPERMKASFGGLMNAKKYAKRNRFSVPGKIKDSDIWPNLCTLRKVAIYMLVWADRIVTRLGYIYDTITN